MELGYFSNAELQDATTDNNDSASVPRSLSPIHASARAKIAARIASTVLINIYSAASSHDTEPVSLGPDLKPSQYARSLIKAYRNHPNYSVVSETIELNESLNGESSCSFSADTNNGPRSFSPCTANIEGEMTSADTENSSFSSNDTGPISIDAHLKPSKYATNLIKAYRNHLEYTLSEPEDINESQVNDITPSSVTSMKYCNSMFGLYGHYFGQVDNMNSIPDGFGILCTHDGKLLEGKWRRGEFVEDDDSFASESFDSLCSLSTCDISSCNSMSASVTRNNNVSRFRETKKLDVSKVPENIYVPARRKSVHWFDKDEVKFFHESED